ncbi:hypothetical protein CR513_51291, partial [Mucuna pruriens]
MFFHVISPLLNLPTCFSDMLEGFKDVFPKDIPYGLLPIRGVQYYINLSLGTSSPNRPTSGANLEDDMLEGFKDVFPKEIPYGLLLMRGIQYYIKLSLGTSLPNRPTYRANLEEFK